MGGDGADNTAALAFGGQPGGPSGTQTEDWNGVSWQETSDLSTGRVNLGSAGISTAALGFGGEGPPATLTNTEEFSFPSNSTRTISTD